MESITLRPNFFKEICLLCTSLIFVAAGVWAEKSGKPFGWLAILFFGFCALLFFIKTLPGFSFLRLDKDGFTEAIHFRTTTIHWKDIDRFAVCYGKVRYEFSKNQAMRDGRRRRLIRQLWFKCGKACCVIARMEK
jgi:hypothetical protein